MGKKKDNAAQPAAKAAKAKGAAPSPLVGATVALAPGFKQINASKQLEKKRQREILQLLIKQNDKIKELIRNHADMRDCIRRPACLPPGTL